MTSSSITQQRLRTLHNRLRNAFVLEQTLSILAACVLISGLVKG